SWAPPPRAPAPHPSKKTPWAGPGPQGKDPPRRGDAEHALPFEVTLLAELDEIVEQRARHLGPEVASHVEIGLEPAGLRFALEAQRMIAPACHPVVDVGAEMQHLAMISLLGLKLDREERRVFDDDPAFLDRRDQEVFVPFPLEDRGEELHQRRPPDRGLEIEPSAVRRDAHIEVAAKRRIPQMH